MSQKPAETQAAAPADAPKMPRLSAALDRLCAVLDALGAPHDAHDGIVVEIPLDPGLFAEICHQREGLAYALGVDVPLASIARRALVRGLTLSRR